MQELTGIPKILDSTNLVFGAIVSFMTIAFGEYWFLFAGFLVCNVFDWVTGNIKAMKMDGISSVKGAKGILKKVFYWGVIGIAFFIGASFDEMGAVIGINLNFMGWLGWMTLATYLVNEISSILENLVAMGVEVPDFLVSMLNITKKLMEAKDDQYIGTANEDKGDKGDKDSKDKDK